MSTSAVVSARPDMLRTGDFLYSGAVCYEVGGLAVAVSGARGITDEMIAKIIYDAIIGFCQLVREAMQAAGENLLRN